MRSTIQELWQRRELLLMLTGRNLKIRYKSSALGFFWSLLTPLLLIGMYAIFAHIMKFNGERPDYFQFLVVGIVAWHFLSMCLNDSLAAIAGNSNLIKKTAFPKLVLPLSMILANLVNFLLTLGVLMVFLLTMHPHFGAWWMLPLVVATQTALCLGLSLIAATSNVFYRDTEHMLNVGMLAWFFLSPVFYPVDFQLGRIRDSLDWVAFLNPMTGILCAYRGVFIGDASGSWFPIISFAVSWTIFLIGLALFRGKEEDFADEL